MFEEHTFDAILQRMLGRIDNSFDKRAGSVIYDALAPAAVEITSLYIAFDSMLNEMFGDTASRDFLVRLCGERGIIPDPASNAVLQAAFSGADVPVGARFTGGNHTYTYVGENKVRCEQSGTDGNNYIGAIIPIDYIDGLESAAITGILIYGDNEENVYELRKKYFESFGAKAFSGNKKDYHDKTLAIPGIGAVKVTPVWNGAGTVKLTILDSIFGKATNILINTVQAEFDANKDGMGNGLAPIGHIVTVDTVTEFVCNVTSTVVIDTTYDQTAVKDAISAAIDVYLNELRRTWADQSALVIRIAQIDTRIMSVQGVVDVSGTKINESAANATLTAYQIPVLGGVTVG